MQSQVPEKVRREGVGGFGAEPGQVKQGSEEVSGEGSEGSGEGSRKLWCKAKSGVTGFWRRFPEKVRVQSQVRFNRVPGKVLEKVPESQVRFNGFRTRFQGFGEVSGDDFGNLWCRARSSSTAFRRRFPEKVRRARSSSTGFWRKVPGSLGAKPSQVQRVLDKVAEKIPEDVLGIFGAGPGQVQRVPEKVA